MGAFHSKPFHIKFSDCYVEILGNYSQNADLWYLLDPVFPALEWTRTPLSPHSLLEFPNTHP